MKYQDTNIVKSIFFQQLHKLVKFVEILNLFLFQIFIIQIELYFQSDGSPSIQNICEGNKKNLLFNKISPTILTELFAFKHYFTIMSMTKNLFIENDKDDYAKHTDGGKMVKLYFESQWRSFR